ncbi:16S rRNA processing protein [Campylobacter blaseri]|uniref:Ribosome maturation factor RimM n=1 Tax=Campylobacter blaseri TaxID=2042961 RepID=A0A2P8R080_9BACT|nr:ribosome maturation factor RimM [Campylobacter blaseri]PSM51903.1 16S rRNA processing protein RimM [Campylobacter blaseri]PSM53687.1 16S rRNA processing protein RimM [Campylobacter blaseri]QKF85760.1 16S rRNA processing protein [Campylobacter blaseri]
MEKLLEVAVIGKTIGLKGALKLHNKSDFVSQFKKGKIFFLKDETKLEILSVNMSNLSVIFKGYEDINLAQNLVNKKLYQSIENTRKSCKLDKDEFFYFDIIGLEVYEDDHKLGRVDDILEVGGSYLFEIKTDEDFIKKEFSDIFYIPYIDNYIEKISIEDGKIYSKNAILLLENS